MGYSPAWHNKYSTPIATPTVTQDQPSMSILAMTSPHPHSGFGREMPWESNNRPAEFVSRQHGEPERVSLPSIRLAFPEIHLRTGNQDAHSRTPSSVTSPPAAVRSGAMTPPDYIHSPSNKRRRLSVEDELEIERASRVPRLYESSAAMSQQRQLSPPPSRRSAEIWTPASRASPYPPQHCMPPMQAAPPALDGGERHDPRHALPSLPPMQTFEPREPIHAQRPRGHSSEDFQQPRNIPMNPAMPNHGHPYRPDAGYPYGYHHPSRGQSLSVGAIPQPFERNAFSAGGYGQPYHHPDFMRIGEVGPMGMNGDSKQRKRRGNLPKETTDKLRAWFVAHLQHPYPTEDEKQDLMRQTGLQMNQISNWFINARRRQLPTMMNNARAESDVMAGNRPGGAAGVPSKVLPTTERADHYGAPDVNEPGKARSSVPLSDGEGSYHDEELDALNHRGRSAHIKRGSV